MSAQASIEIPPRLDELNTVNGFIDSFAESEEWREDLLFNVRLILEELCINIINHGEIKSEQPIKVTLRSDEENVTVEITDKGIPFDPTQGEDPEQLTQAISERPIGGLGVYLVRKLTDEMRYKRLDDSNQLTLVKRR